jgi:hypothetical protein
MDKVMEFLKGKKTYFIAGAGAVIQGLALAGVITQDQANQVLVLLGFGGFASLRAAK